MCEMRVVILPMIPDLPNTGSIAGNFLLSPGTSQHNLANLEPNPSVVAHAGSASMVATLNQPATSFAVLDSSNINVSPSGAAPVLVQRNLLASPGEPVQYYLPVEDAVKVGLEHNVDQQFLLGYLSLGRNDMSLFENASVIGLSMASAYVRHS